jgi:photosynthetic reaction center cytochrome c subunit
VKNTKKFVRKVIGIVAPLALAIVAMGAPATRLAAQAPAGAPPLPATAANLNGKTAEQFYKKIDALKGIPAAEVHPAMEYITTALGVGCGYCHVPGKFDSDDKKEKNVARSMIRMTMALNNTVFDAKREITCYTCHRGAAKASPTLALAGDKVPTEPSGAEIFPAVSLMSFSSLDPNMSPSKAPATVMSGPAPAPKMAAPVALPSVDDVFSKYEEALGGKAAIAKVTSLVHKGMAEMLVPSPPVPQGAPPPPPPAMGSVPAELTVKSPKGLISVVFPGRGPQMMGFDGTIGWTNTPNREETGGELIMVKELGEAIPALEFRKQHTNVQVDAMEKIGDRPVYRVVGARKEGITALDRVYFDAQTGLLARTYSTMQSVLGGFPEEISYEDYRDVSGLKVPFTMRVVSAEGYRTYTWAQVEANAPVEDSKFTKPEPPPPPPARPAAD